MRLVLLAAILLLHAEQPPATAGISSRGCVTDARVFKTLEESLDIGALQAVHRWIYEWPRHPNAFALRTSLSVSYGMLMR